MKERLVSAINEIRNNKSMLMSDEASIKSGVILRLLSILGWNPFDVNEVKPEYTVESKRVDFSLRINGTNKVFIEVKRPNENLETHQEQLLGYSFREGAKQAILTNGITWWFYLPLNEGSWQQRRFFTADFLQQDPNAIAEKLFILIFSNSGRIVFFNHPVIFSLLVALSKRLMTVIKKYIQRFVGQPELVW